MGTIYAGLGILIWLPLFSGELSLPTTFSPIDWHIHEMLYGYLPAIITGFVLTAIPNWTGRLPLQGKPLAVLVAVWIAGRVAVGFSAIIGPLAAGASTSSSSSCSPSRRPARWSSGAIGAICRRS